MKLFEITGQPIKLFMPPEVDEAFMDWTNDRIADMPEEIPPDAVRKYLLYTDPSQDYRGMQGQKFVDPESEDAEEKRKQWDIGYENSPETAILYTPTGKVYTEDLLNISDSNFALIKCTVKQMDSWMKRCKPFVGPRSAH
jgi:hypothetical protein